LPQKINPELFLINPALTFITFIMYFTIENPDLKGEDIFRINEKIKELEKKIVNVIEG